MFDVINSLYQKGENLGDVGWMLIPLLGVWIVRRLAQWWYERKKSAKCQSTLCFCLKPFYHDGEKYGPNLQGWNWSIVRDIEITAHNNSSLNNYYHVETSIWYS